MGKILEPDIETGFRYPLLTGLYQLVCGLQPAFNDPFLRRQVANFGKIAFERRQTATGITCDLFHRQVIHVVIVQIVDDVYFPRINEIEQLSVEILVRV